LALFFLPLISQAQIFPSDSLTWGISSINSIGYTVIIPNDDIDKTLLSGTISVKGGVAGNLYSFVCYSYNENDNLNSFFNYQLDGNGNIDINFFNNSLCPANTGYDSIAIYSTNATEAGTITGNINYVLRDIANTDDPRLMPVQLTDFYDTANQGLKLLIFWVQIGIIAWFFLVVVLYRFFWKWLGFGRFFRN